MLIKHPNCKCITDDKCLMHDYELQKSVKKFQEELSEIRQLDATIASLRAEVERLNKVIDRIKNSMFGWGDVVAWRNEIDRMLKKEEK